MQGPGSQQDRGWNRGICGRLPRRPADRRGAREQSEQKEASMKYVPGEYIRRELEYWRPLEALRVALDLGYYDGDYVVVTDPEWRLPPEEQVLRLAQEKWGDAIVSFEDIVAWAGTDALAPQEPLPFGNASCPSPSRPVTLSAFGQLAPSEVRQAARTHHPEESAQHPSSRARPARSQARQRRPVRRGCGGLNARQER